MSQTFSLVATTLGLGSFATAALRNELFEKKLDLDPFEEPVFLLNGVGNIDKLTRHERPIYEIRQ